MRDLSYCLRRGKKGKVRECAQLFCVAGTSQLVMVIPVERRNGENQLRGNRHICVFISTCSSHYHDVVCPFFILCFLEPDHGDTSNK